MSIWGKKKKWGWGKKGWKMAGNSVGRRNDEWLRGGIERIIKKQIMGMKIWSWTTEEKEMRISLSLSKSVCVCRSVLWWENGRCCVSAKKLIEESNGTAMDLRCPKPLYFITLLSLRYNLCFPNSSTISAMLTSPVIHFLQSPPSFLLLTRGRCHASKNWLN